MPDAVYTNVDKYIRGIGTDYEPGLKLSGVSVLEDKYMFAKKIETSDSVNANSVAGEPPYDELDKTMNIIINFYGSKNFSWIIKSSEKYEYLKEALSNIGMVAEKTFFGMYFSLDDYRLETISGSKFLVTEAKNEHQISDVVDLTCKIFNITMSERNDMIQERMASLDNPENRSGFALAYVDGKPVGYSRHRFSHDGIAMYLTGSGVLKEFRGKHIYYSLLKYRSEIAVKNGCKILTVLAREDTSKPILEKLGFRTEGKYLFMTRSKQV